MKKWKGLVGVVLVGLLLTACGGGGGGGGGGGEGGDNETPTQPLGIFTMHAGGGNGGLQGGERPGLEELKRRFEKQIVVTARPSFHIEQFEIVVG
jgi:ABC-type glycerol-3-phosphate transport system substrate-binding protein